MIENKSIPDVSVDLCRIVGGRLVIRILICDDDIVMLEKVRSRIEEFFHGSDIKIKIHAFSDVSQISTQILSSCDLALLDIDFDKLNYSGMDLARRLRALRKDAVIIFITNYIEYAPEGYEVQAFRYILKKELDDELEAYIRQAIEQLNMLKKTFKIQINGEIIDLPLDEILYMEVQQHNVTAYVQKDLSGKNVKGYSFYASLSDIEKQLEPLGFLRIHKSYLVNMRHLKKFQCREAVLTSGDILRVGEKSYAVNKKKYLLWKGWH